MAQKRTVSVVLLSVSSPVAERASASLIVCAFLDLADQRAPR